MTNEQDSSEPQVSAQDAAEAALKFREFWDQTLSVPAVYANQVFVLANSIGVRIAFGESLDADAAARIRTSVALGDFQAYQLWAALDQSDAVQRVRNFLSEQNEDDATKT